MEEFPKLVTFVCFGTYDGYSKFFSRHVVKIENGNIFLDSPAMRAKDATYVGILWFNLRGLPDEYDRLYTVTKDGYKLVPITDDERDFLDGV